MSTNSKTTELSARWHAFRSACEAREMHRVAADALEEEFYGLDDDDPDDQHRFDELRWELRSEREETEAHAAVCDDLYREFWDVHEEAGEGRGTGECECAGCRWYRAEYYCCGEERLCGWCEHCGRDAKETRASA